MKKMILRFYELLFLALPCLGLIMLAGFIVYVVKYCESLTVFFTLMFFGLYAFVDFVSWLVSREIEKCPEAEPEKRALRLAGSFLHLTAIILLFGIAGGFFRLMLEWSDFTALEVALIYLAGILLGLLLVLRRRRNKNKEEE